jgi:hypothetical protein
LRGCGVECAGCTWRFYGYYDGFSCMIGLAFNAFNGPVFRKSLSD